MLNTKAKLGFLNAYNDLSICWAANVGEWELISEITGEIWQSKDRTILETIRVKIAFELESLPYPNIPFGKIYN